MKNYIVLVHSKYTSVGIADPENEEVYIDECLDVSLGVFEAENKDQAKEKAKIDFMYDTSIMTAYEIEEAEVSVL